MHVCLLFIIRDEQHGEAPEAAQVETIKSTAIKIQKEKTYIVYFSHLYKDLYTLNVRNRAGVHDAVA